MAVIELILCVEAEMGTKEVGREVLLAGITL